jgi:hypothetical protein
MRIVWETMKDGPSHTIPRQFEPPAIVTSTHHKLPEFFLWNHTYDSTALLLPKSQIFEFSFFMLPVLFHFSFLSPYYIMLSSIFRNKIHHLATTSAKTQLTRRLYSTAPKKVNGDTNRDAVLSVLMGFGVYYIIVKEPEEYSKLLWMQCETLY